MLLFDQEIAMLTCNSVGVDLGWRRGHSEHTTTEKIRKLRLFMTCLINFVLTIVVPNFFHSYMCALYVKVGLILMHRSIDPRNFGIIMEQILLCRVRSHRLFAPQKLNPSEISSTKNCTYTIATTAGEMNLKYKGTIQV